MDGYSIEPSRCFVFNKISEDFFYKKFSIEKHFMSST